MYRCVLIMVILLLFLSNGYSQQYYRNELRELYNQKMAERQRNYEKQQQALIDYSLNRQLDLIADQIVSSLVYSGDSTLAVVDFSNLDGKVSELGRLISEELTTRLFRYRKFLIIERQLLEKIVREHQFMLSDLSDKRSIIMFGQIAGVQAIISGTLSEFGNYIKINSRIISTINGLIFAVASGEVLKDQSVSNLFNKKARPLLYDKQGSNNKTKAQVVSSYEIFKQEGPLFSVKDLGTSWEIREYGGVGVTFDRYRTAIWVDKKKEIDKTYLLREPFYLEPLGSMSYYISEKNEVIEKASWLWGFYYQVWLVGKDDNGNNITITMN